MYAPLLSPIHSACLTYLILLNLITQIFGEKYRPLSSSLCRVLQFWYLIMQSSPVLVPHYAEFSSPGTSLCSSPVLVPHYAEFSSPGTSLCRVLKSWYLIIQSSPVLVPHYAEFSSPGTSLCRVLQSWYLIMQSSPVLVPHPS